MSVNPLLGALEQARRNWGWYLVLGIALILLGMFALANSPEATAATVILFGWVLVVSGCVQLVQAFKSAGFGGIFLHLLAGVLELIVGLIAALHPVESALTLTLLLAVYLLVGGIFRMVAAMVLAFPGCGWVVLGGLITALLGGALVAQWPVSGFWFIGTCVGVDLIVNGASWVAFALSVKRLPSAGGLGGASG